MNKQDAFNQLKKFEEAVAACNRCGFCTSYCPTYNATGNEVHSPRGRNQMARALMEGKMPMASLAKESIDTCLLCGECTSVCFSEVPTAQIMVETRNFLNSSLGISVGLSYFLEHVLPYPKRLVWALRFGFILKNMGVPRLLRKLGLLQRFAPTADAADQLLDHAPNKFLLDYSDTRKYQEKVQAALAQITAIKETKKPELPTAPAPKKFRVAYMPVCGSQYVRPQIGLSTIKLFERLRLDFIIPEALCCGLPAASYGVKESVQHLARENIRRFDSGSFEQIVVDDSSCAAHLKSYAEFFHADPNMIPRAHEMAQKVRELSVFLIQRGLQEHLKLAPWTGDVVAYHDPCKAQYGQHLTSPPRELLASIPRLRVVPISDADQCCGGAGTYSFVHPEMSQNVLADKIENIIASGCKIVVTSSASCLTQLAFGLRKKNSNIEALHLTEFLVRALEKKR